VSVQAPTQRLPYLALLGLGALDAAGYSVIVPVTPAIAAATGAGPALTPSWSAGAARSTSA
jgi:hypothetical protein